MPQVPPGAQLAALALVDAPPLGAREAMVDSFFFTCRLPQVGHSSFAMAALLNTSSSKGSPHSWQSNS
jgi:hypothetical protein